jgi:hypothetical protein
MDSFRGKMGKDGLNIYICGVPQDLSKFTNKELKDLIIKIDRLEVNNNALNKMYRTSLMNHVCHVMKNKNLLF